jgi:hypothetical protein
LTHNPLEHPGKMLQAVNHFKSFCSAWTRPLSLAISGSASEPGSATRRARVRTHGEKLWGSTSPPVLTRILSCAARFCSFSVGMIVCSVKPLAWSGSTCPGHCALANPKLHAYCYWRTSLASKRITLPGWSSSGVAMTCHPFHAGAAGRHFRLDLVHTDSLSDSTETCVG